MTKRETTKPHEMAQASSSVSTPFLDQVAAGSRLKAVVFDFDGVILESVDIKTRAFRILFQDHGAHLKRIVQLHRDNAGLSRYEKFQIIYRDFLKRPLPDEEVRRLDRAFSGLVVAEILACPLVPGAQEFLSHAVLQWPLFVVSGTPQAELLEIVRRRGLDRYFRRVYGSPRSKEVLLHEILTDNGWSAEDLVFVGDGLTDYRAAAAVGIPFVARVANNVSTLFPSSVQWTVTDLRDLMSRWMAVMSHFSGA